MLLLLRGVSSEKPWATHSKSSWWSKSISTSWKRRSLFNGIRSEEKVAKSSSWARESRWSSCWFIIYICPRVHLMSLNIYSLWVTKFGFQKHGRGRAFFEPRKFLLGGWWMVDGGWTMSWHGAAWAASRLKRLQEPLRGSKNNNPSGLRPKRPRSRCAAPDTISDFRLF